MKFVLVNPPWNFEGSVYFGCPSPHLALELSYSEALLLAAGHEVLLIDAFLMKMSLDNVVARLRSYRADVLVVPTAPSYLFWRCAQPELRIPQEIIAACRQFVKQVIVVGPHGSTTPRATVRKLNADLVVLGECEDILPQIDGNWSSIDSIAYPANGEVRVQGVPHATPMTSLPALEWPDEMIAAHRHHHHRFDAAPAGPGAEVEASRGCPYNCSFCAKEIFRNKFRRRPAAIVLTEIDRLLSQGVEYVYFIDEIFLPDRELLDGLADRRVKIGVQTRIDLWNEDATERLARAGCVSVEAGVESITEAGRAYLDKRCKVSTDDLAGRLVFAKRLIPFVQANLLSMQEDDMQEVERWRGYLLNHGVWSNKPVPLFPYPGSPEYTRRWGTPDDNAWERAHEYYLTGFDEFSDIQDQRPMPLVQLEAAARDR